jgi:hypothetical protein
MRYYVYLYVDEEAVPYYVGKGTNSRCIDCHGDVPIPSDNRIIKILEDVEEKDALNKERELIHKYKRICDGGTLMNKVVPTGKSRTRPGAYAANMKQETLDKFRNLCKSRNIQYTKMLEKFAEYYVEVGGEVKFLNSEEETLTERIVRLERAVSKLVNLK